MNLVGFGDGCIVGFLVGLCVGFRDGLAEGFLVGFLVGFIVGNCEEGWLGTGEGIVEGLYDIEGSFVGDGVMLSVGGSVGKMQL